MIVSKIISIFPKQIRNAEFSHLSRNKEDLELEQPNLTDIFCPHCHEECWISEKKRFIARTQRVVIMCWNCIADNMESLKAKGVVRESI